MIEKITLAAIMWRVTLASAARQTKLVVDGNGSTAQQSKLVMVLPAPCRLLPNGMVSLSKKLVSGMIEHQHGWPGAIHAVLPPAVGQPGMEDGTFDIDELPFKLTIAPAQHPDIAAVINGAALVMFSAQVGYASIPALCKSVGVPCIGITEYTLRTRLDVARAEAKDPLRLMKRMAQELVWEIGNRRAVRTSTGIQSNGVPTFDVYKRINPNPILYLDTRVRTQDLATQQDLDRRFATRRALGKLRLAFSGRLTLMKGVEKLLPMACALRDKGVRFNLKICGDGELAQRMTTDISRLGLRDSVEMTGSLDFASELVPLVKRDVDVFVCCHPQGDPSCTYLETMSCGVPIIGFSNEAFTGLHAMSRSGWITPINRPDLMADRIAALTDDEIEAHSTTSLNFASEHSFEIEFHRRMQHARDIAGVAST